MFELKLWRTFDALLADDDRSDGLSRREMDGALWAARFKMGVKGRSQLAKLFTEFDKNKDGRIQWKEFKELGKRVTCLADLDPGELEDVVDEGPIYVMPPVTAAEGLARLRSTAELLERCLDGWVQRSIGEAAGYDLLLPGRLAAAHAGPSLSLDSSREADARSEPAGGVGLLPPSLMPLSLGLSRHAPLVVKNYERILEREVSHAHESGYESGYGLGMRDGRLAIAQREATALEATARESVAREAAAREAAAWEASARETAEREADTREAAAWEAARTEAVAREAAGATAKSMKKGPIPL